MWLAGWLMAPVSAADAALTDGAADASALIAAGRKTAGFCANYHGQSGLSKYPDVPNLAGQNPAYLLRQLDAFAAGRRRNDFMEGLVKMLSADDRAAVVAYYASLPVTPSRAGQPT